MLIKAKLSDAKEIYHLIEAFSQKEIMLPRSLNCIYQDLRDFWLYKDGSKILGCCALHVVGWEDLGEIRSLSIIKNAQKNGIGKKLVGKCLEEAKQLGLKKVFALSCAPDFFQKLDFKIISKDKLPHKIWTDCVSCRFFPDCKETAVLMKI